LADELITREGLESLQILVVTGNQNRKSLIQKLEQQGRAIVDTLPLYKTSQADLSQSQAAADYREKGADAVLFTSTSTVKSFVEQQAALKLDTGACQPLYGSIGSLTSQSLREHNLPIAFEAEKANLKCFVDSTISALSE
jgi:uroporphyrinogen-III synthase